MGRLSAGKEKQVTVMGGQDAGWIAAVAEWLFDFKVVVHGQDGARLYSNCGHFEPEVVVVVVFNYEMGADERTSLQTHPWCRAGHQFRTITERSCRMALPGQGIW